MKIYFIIQLLFIGLICGIALYKKDNNIESMASEKSDPAPLLFWVIICMLRPLAAMWCIFIDAIEKIGDKNKEIYLLKKDKGQKQK